MIVFKLCIQNANIDRKIIKIVGIKFFIFLKIIDFPIVGRLMFQCN